MVLTLVSSIVYSAFVSKEEYGLYNLILSIAFYFSVIGEWGISAFAVREISRAERHSLKEKFSLLLESKIVLVLISIVGFLVFAYLFDYYKLGIGVILPIVALIFVTAMQLDWYLQGREYFNQIAVRQILTAFVSLSVGLLAVLVWPKALTIAGSQILGLLAGFLFSWNTISRKDFHIVLGKLTNGLGIVSQTIRKTSGIFLGILLFHASYNVSFAVMANLSQMQEMGVYSTYYRIFSSATGAFLVFFNLYSVRIARGFSEDVQRPMYFGLSRMGFYAALGMILFGPLVYKFIYGSKYDFNFDVLFYFSLLLFVAAVNYFFIQVWSILGHSRKFVACYLTGFLANILMLSFFKHSNVTLTSGMIVKSLLTGEAAAMLVGYGIAWKKNFCVRPVRDVVFLIIAAFVVYASILVNGQIMWSVLLFGSVFVLDFLAFKNRFQFT